MSIGRLFGCAAGAVLGLVFLGTLAKSGREPAASSETEAELLRGANAAAADFPATFAQHESGWSIRHVEGRTFGPWVELSAPDNFRPARRGSLDRTLGVIACPAATDPIWRKLGATQTIAIGAIAGGFKVAFIDCRTFNSEARAGLSP